MEKIAKTLQLTLMCIILVSTVIAVGIEIKNMFLNQSVMLADLLLMFLYLEVLAMVRVFWSQQSISNISRFTFNVSLPRSFSDGKSFLEPAIN